MKPKLKLIVNQYLESAKPAHGGGPERLRGLLANGYDPNAGNEHGATLLHWAAVWDNVPVAAILLDHGADIHARDSLGSTPLHKAAFSGGEEMIGLLLDRGADINVRDDGGWTPLHSAARLGRVEEAGFLLRRGAEAGIRDDRGRTPLDVVLDNDFLQDRWATLGRLLGDGNRRAEAGQSLPSPGEIGRSRSRPHRIGMVAVVEGGRSGKPVAG